jgi:hypothetical protein
MLMASMAEGDKMEGEMDFRDYDKLSKAEKV